MQKQESVTSDASNNKGGRGRKGDNRNEKWQQKNNQERQRPPPVILTEVDLQNKIGNLFKSYYLKTGQSAIEEEEVEAETDETQEEAKDKTPPAKKEQKPDFAGVMKELTANTFLAESTEEEKQGEKPK